MNKYTCDDVHQKAALLDELIADAKALVDEADDTDMFFEFTLGVAGLDGDPEYQ